MAAIGLALGLVLTFRAGLQAGMDRRKLTDLVLWALVGGLLGAKVLLMLIEIPASLESPWTWVTLFGRVRRIPRILVIWQGGLVYFGGLLGGVLGALWHLRRAKEIAFTRAADAIAPAISLGHIWGRLGCFLAGCCYGKAGGGELGVSYGATSQVYETHSSLDLLQPPFEHTYLLHPVQLYEAAAELVLSAFLLWLAPRKRFPGQVALAYLGLYAGVRFVLEIFRGDRLRGFVGGTVAFAQINRWLGVDGGSPTFLSVSQAGALAAMLLCLWLWMLARSRERR
jgi:phosphatidylglycerol:prolipoprotein diacylglycerol transferase